MTLGQRYIVVSYARHKGRHVALPKSEDAHLFCKLLGTEALSGAHLEVIRALRFEIEELRQPPLRLVGDMMAEVDAKLDAVMEAGRSREADRIASRQAHDARIAVARAARQLRDYADKVETGWL